MKSDLDIARSISMRPVAKLANEIGITESEIDLYGKYKAKIGLKILQRLASRSLGKYILVTAMTPTPLGEGKTLTTLGLTLGLNRSGVRAVATIRQPSMGPVFGIKGGAAGGGFSQVVPMEDFNLHLTGDFHAVAVANNLLAAYVDTSMLHKNPYRLNPFTIRLRRVVDVNDRALRHTIVGCGGRLNGLPRETGFDIVAASEVMAILGLAKGYADMRERLGSILVGRSLDRQDVTARDMKAAGAMAVVLKEAIKPTLMQTTEGTGVLIHTGPFANIAHGNSSILADEIALRLADYVVTEAGFGADMGAEKFFNIKCRISGRKPDAAVGGGAAAA
jgi:formyltetrahydrofolate synthetase